MTIGNIVRTRPVPVLYGLMIASLMALLPLPPLLQDQAYHQFADRREVGMPNFWNVVFKSAIRRCGRRSVCCNFIATRRPPCFCRNISDRLWLVLYHLDPNDSTLFGIGCP